MCWKYFSNGNSIAICRIFTTGGSFGRLSTFVAFRCGSKVWNLFICWQSCFWIHWTRLFPNCVQASQWSRMGSLLQPKDQKFDKSNRNNDKWVSRLWRSSKSHFWDALLSNNHVRSESRNGPIWPLKNLIELINAANDDCNWSVHAYFMEKCGKWFEEWDKFESGWRDRPTLSIDSWLAILAGKRAWC